MIVVLAIVAAPSRVFGFGADELAEQIGGAASRGARGEQSLGDGAGGQVCQGASGEADATGDHHDHLGPGGEHVVFRDRGAGVGATRSSRKRAHEGVATCRNGGVAASGNTLSERRV